MYSRLIVNNVSVLMANNCLSPQYNSKLTFSVSGNTVTVSQRDNKNSNNNIMSNMKISNTFVGNKSIVTIGNKTFISDNPNSSVVMNGNTLFINGVEIDQEQFEESSTLVLEGCKFEYIEIGGNNSLTTRGSDNMSDNCTMVTRDNSHIVIQCDYDLHHVKNLNVECHDHSSVVGWYLLVDNLIATANDSSRIRRFRVNHRATLKTTHENSSIDDIIRMNDDDTLIITEGNNIQYD